MLTAIETKLIALALDRGAYEGEAEAAAIQLIRKLRERGATPDEFAPSSNKIVYVRDPEPPRTHGGKYGSEILTFGKYRGERLKDVPLAYLVWVLDNCENITPRLRQAIAMTVYGD